jgi:hypothetical protein
MSTGLESFASPSGIGAMYPFVGTEVILVIVGVTIWIGWHIWQIGAENRELAESERKAREAGIK